ncbi:hypothetical protein Tco_1439378 [Tanacetum coccineum]
MNLDNPLCPNESKILANILQNHPLRFSIATSSSVPWIYLGQSWHTRLSFMLDRKQLTLTLDDFRTIFQLPQATDNNHEHFVVAPKFSEMVLFYINDLGFRLELRSLSNFKTTVADTVQDVFKMSDNTSHWTALLTQTSINTYSLSQIHKAYYVPTTQTQPIKSTQGTHRTTSAPRSPNPAVDDEESSASRKSTVIRLHIPQRRSTRLTPPTPLPTTIEADDIVLQDTIQLSLAKQKSRDELEAKQMRTKVEEPHDC